MPTKNKSIKLSGLATSPSEYNSEDGNLSLALGAVHENGDIEPFHQTRYKKLFKSHSKPSSLNIGDIWNEKVIYIHKNAGFTHYITKHTAFRMHMLDHGVAMPAEVTEIGYFDEQSLESGNPVILPIIEADAITIASVGNILIIYTSDDHSYFSWKNDAYKYLGNDIPEPNISFGLKHHQGITAIIDKDGSKLAYYVVPGDNTPNTDGTFAEGVEVKSDNDSYHFNADKTEVTFESGFVPSFDEAVHGEIDRFINTQAYDKGRFFYPFLVRFALRLFDGSHTKASAPVLMMTTSGLNPFVVIDQLWPKSIMFHVEGSSFSLDYAIDSSDKNKLVEWNDIVRGVDIFVSSPIYLENTKEKIRTAKYLVKNNGVGGFYLSYDMRNHCVAKSERSETYGKMETLSERYDGSALVAGEANAYYIKDSIYHLIGYPVFQVNIPQRSSLDISNDIASRSLFYLIKSIDIKDLSTERSDISIESGALHPDSLQAKQALQEDFESHDKTIPSGATVYNGRVNQYGVKKYLYGFDRNIKPEYLFPYQNDFSEGSSNLTLLVRSRENERDIVVSSRTSTVPSGFVFQYFFYPNPNADRLDIKLTGSTSNTHRVSLSEHIGLNGSVVVAEGFDRDHIYDNGNKPSSEYENLIETDIKYTIINDTVYTSNVDNPFVFLAKNVERINGSQIISLIPQTEALSQGQFGQYPMTCFTTEGLWAMSVSEDGGWKAKQPFSRDVVLNNNPGNILQMDKEVLFSTSRGLMLVSGSNIQCISEVFDGAEDNFLLLHADDINRMVRSPLSDVSKDIMTGKGLVHEVSFRNYISNAVYLYDYTHQRIIVGNPDFNFCYVFCKKDKLWMHIPARLVSRVNSYPDCLAMALDTDGRNILVDFSKEDSYAQSADALIITRTIKLDAPDVMKTVSCVVVRGDFKTNTSSTAGHVDIILYGSRDMFSWVVIGSCHGNRLVLKHGSPFRYFRVAIIAHLERGESISAIDFAYEYKMTNKLR